MRNLGVLMYAGIESLQQFRNASPSGTISFSPLLSAGSPAHPQVASRSDVTKPIWTFGEFTPLLYGFGDLTRCAFGVLGLLASWITFLLRWSAIVSDCFASAAICSCVSCRDFRTALSSDSVWPSFKSHAWLGPTSASGGTRQVGRDERTGWETVRGHIQPNAEILCWTWCSQ